MKKIKQFLFVLSLKIPSFESCYIGKGSRLFYVNYSWHKETLSVCILYVHFWCKVYRQKFSPFYH